MRVRHIKEILVQPFIAALACMSACLLATACGHGVHFLEPEGSAANITAVVVTLNPAQITTQQQTQALAIVQGTGTYDSSVTWSVMPASMGTITALGLFTPSGVGTASIVATSVGNPKISGSATLTIYEAGSAPEYSPPRPALQVIIPGSKSIQ
jgi:hypothetical protein